MAALDSTADEKLTGFALRILLSDHVAIPHESQPDLLTEVEQVFAPKKSKLLKSAPKASGAKKQAAKAQQKGGNRKEGGLMHRILAPDSSGSLCFKNGRKIDSVSPWPLCPPTHLNLAIVSEFLDDLG